MFMWGVHRTLILRPSSYVKQRVCLADSFLPLPFATQRLTSISGPLYQKHMREDEPDNMLNSMLTQVASQILLFASYPSRAVDDYLRTLAQTLSNTQQQAPGAAGAHAASREL